MSERRSPDKRSEQPKTATQPSHVVAVPTGSLTGKG